MNPLMTSKRGAAALEYILISTFAVALSVATLLVLSKMVKDEVGRISDKLGVSLDTSAFDGLGTAP